MDISKNEKDGVNVLTVAGKLDSNNASEFDAKLREFIDEDSGKPVILNFAGVQTLTSAPLRAILSLAKRMQRHQSKLFIAAPGENALESLRISGFLKLKIFELTDTMDAALQLARQNSNPAPILPASAVSAPAIKLPNLTGTLGLPRTPTPPPAPSVASQPVAPPSVVPPPLAPAPVAPPPVAPPPVAPPPLAPAPVPPPPLTPPPVAPPSVTPPPAAPPAVTSPPVAPTPIKQPQMVRLPAKQPASPAPPVTPIAPPPIPQPAKRAPAPDTPSPTGLSGWFYHWSCEVQNALDYWIQVLKGKK